MDRATYKVQATQDNGIVVGLGVSASEADIAAARAEIVRMVSEEGVLEPDRGTLSDETIEWREGKPDYTLANLSYLKGKTQNHAAGSLELVVENMVKRWEMEASHFVNYAQWTTVKQAEYKVQTNGGCIYSGEQAKEMGNYNWLMSGCPKDLYDFEKETFESSHSLFRTAFPDGFPWEVVEVYSGPPKVAFKWRHWANYSGTYKSKQGDGEICEMLGFGVITLSDMKVTDLEIYYKPEEFLRALHERGSE